MLSEYQGSRLCFSNEPFYFRSTVTHHLFLGHLNEIQENRKWKHEERCKNCGCCNYEKKEGISSFQEHVLLICALHLNFEILVRKLLLCPRTSLKNWKQWFPSYWKVNIAVKVLMVRWVIRGFWVANLVDFINWWFWLIDWLYNLEEQKECHLCLANLNSA